MSWNPPNNNSAPPPGWYFDGPAQRWWDGRAWGPSAAVPPHPMAPAGGRTAAVFCHVGFFVFSIFLALILRSTEQANPFVRRHATEALNFQITVAVVSFGVFILAFVGTVLGGPIGFLIAWLLLVGMFVCGAVFSVIGAVAASRLEEYRYPLSIRFVKP